MPNLLLSRPLERSEPRSVRERAIAMAHATLRVLRSLRCASITPPRSMTVPAQGEEQALREFAVVIHHLGEPTQERTVWAQRSVDVALDVLEDLQREGCTRFHVQVKALGATRRSGPQ